MNAFQSLDERLAQLGRELGNQPDLPQRVLDELARRAPPTPRRTRSGSLRRIGVRLVPLLAASVLICLVVWWLSHPRTLYARAMAALHRVQTVHVTGWIRHVPRQWPLEAPASSPHVEDVRHPVDAWFWAGKDGKPVSYLKHGPVIQLQRGDDLREYQQDAELLFVSEGRAGEDYVGQFSSLAEYLQRLDRPGIKREELGTRLENGRTLRGLQLTEGNRVEQYWFDEQTDLPARFSRSTRKGGQTRQQLDMTFSYDGQVPMAVARWEPPQTENVRYGRGHADVQLAWRRHVQEIGHRLQEEPLAGRVTLLPRDGKLFAHQWRLKTPDGRHWVRPLDGDLHFRLSLELFIHRAATADGERRFGTWRVPKELHDLQLPHCDLVYEDGTPWQEWVQAALSRLELELVEVSEDCTIWIAEHDGRKLKPWQEVKPPVGYIVNNGVVQRGVVKPGVGQALRPVTMEEILLDLSRDLDRGGLTARQPIIIDHTGLPKAPPFDRRQFENREHYEREVRQKYLVATDSPWFDGSDESHRLARRWFAEKFGVTFKEEVRPMTVHLIRRRQGGQ